MIMKLILLFGVYLSLPSISQGSLREPAQYIDAEEFRHPSSTNEIANHEFQSEGGKHHHKKHHKGLEVIVGKNCSSFRVTFKNKDDRQKEIHLPDNDLCRGHIIDQSKAGKCVSNSYPITCKFHTIDEQNKIDKQKMKNYFPISAKSVEKSISFHEELAIEERPSRGKRDKQVQWVGKAAKKIGASQAEGACMPSYRGKDAPRTVKCDQCWLVFVPILCNCDCRGWTDVPGLPGMCAQPCHEHPGYSVDTGFYCWKDCNRDGQLAFHTGCGFTPVDRTCVPSDGDCVAKIANIVLSITEIISFFVTGPVATAFKKAGMKALTLVGKTAMKDALRLAVKEAAQEMANELYSNKVIKKELTKLGKNARKQVLEQGSELFLVASMGSDPNYGEMALDVAEALDPSGVVGLVRQFIPPEDCDDMIYMEPFPDEEPGLPDLDPLHALDDDLVGEIVSGKVYEIRNMLTGKPENQSYLRETRKVYGSNKFYTSVGPERNYDGCSLWKLTAHGDNTFTIRNMYTGKTENQSYLRETSKVYGSNKFYTSTGPESNGDGCSLWSIKPYHNMMT